MLTRLGSYLFGNESTDDVAVDETQASRKVELNTKEGDMGWVLVDVQGSSRGGDEEMRSSQHEHPNACSCVRDSANLPSSTACSCRVVPLELGVEGESPSDCESQDCPLDLVLYERSSCGPRLMSLLGESWMVTPPPCFTGTGSVSELESNPLENLLIEHPSMSVYSQSQQITVWGQDTREEQSVYPEDPVELEEWIRRKRDEVIQRLEEGRFMRRRQDVEPPRPRPIRASIGAVEQMRAICSQQRLQQTAVGKQLGRKCMERNNKARMVKSSCRKQVSARNRVLRPSGCMSSRHAQRAH